MRGPASISVTFSAAFVEHFQPVVAQLEAELYKLRRQLDRQWRRRLTMSTRTYTSAAGSPCKVRDTRKQWSSSLERKRSACSRLSRKMQCCATPLVPKSLLTEPHRQHQIVVTDAVRAHDLAAILVADRRNQ